MSERTEKKEHIHFVADREDIDYIDSIFKSHGGRSKAMRLALKKYIEYLKSDGAEGFKKALEEMG